MLFEKHAIAMYVPAKISAHVTLCMMSTIRLIPATESISSIYHPKIITRMGHILRISTKEEEALDHIAKLLFHRSKISFFGQVACVPFSGREPATNIIVALAVLVDPKEAPACG